MLNSCKAFVVALAVMVSVLGFAQAPDGGSKEQIEAIKKLDFLVGSWKGTASAISSGRKFEMAGYESVSLKAGGCALLIEAQYKTNAGGTERTVHDVLAILYYDVAKKEYKMMSQLANGLRGDFVVELKGKGFVWSQKHPIFGNVRYTMHMSDTGEWIEIGEREEDGKWVQILEMKLKKS